tara:strand:- start:7571 stop:7768 length:198 start_codon:yes stop_codon:yes gene_type:complete
MYYNNMNTNTKALRVFKLTDNQVSMMCESIMFAYEMDIEERNEWDADEFSSMIDEVVNSYKENVL